MSQEIEGFFSQIYGKSSGYVAIVTKGESGAIDSQRWFHMPEQLTFMAKYVAVRADEDVYCSVGLFSAEERSKDDAQAVANVVYADADTCNPANFRVPPSISVQTSEGRWHAWWVLDTEVSAKDASDASHRVYKAHETQGCDRGWPIAKLLRVPGTANTKKAVPEPVTATYSGDVYTLDTINAVYHDIDIAPVITLDKKVPTPLGSADLLELEQIVANNNLTALYLNVPTEGESWSERMYRLEMDLFRAGLSAVEVFTLAREAACNKYNPAMAGQLTQTGVTIPRRSNPDLVLWQEIQKAEAEYAQSAEAEAADELPRTSGSKTAISNEFLTVDERRYCRETPTFVSQYVEWVATRTDSAEVYQHSMAYLLLACVFGGRGYLPLAWGNTELNLWILILGDTTRTRKSTAKSITLEVLHRYEAVTGIKIDMGSDATAEALHVELGKRDGAASLQHKDEINGWFGSLYSKQYMSGVLESLTELYDGHVPVVLRTGKDSGNKTRARTAFNFVGVGIRKRTAEVLTRNHFESGFLARMLWAVADPPPRNSGSEDLAFRTGIQVNHYQAVSALVEELVARAAMWSQENPQPITMDAAALARYNQWAEEGMQRAERFEDGEAVVPAFQRLKTSVAKAAALLAMYDQTDKITLAQLLPAIGQAEFWFRDMLRMAGEVSASEFERRLDEVEAFIASGDGQMKTEVSVRKKFTRFKPRDWQEIFESLMGSGRIRKVRDKRGYLEALS